MMKDGPVTEDNNKNEWFLVYQRQLTGGGSGSPGSRSYGSGGSRRSSYGGGRSSAADGDGGHQRSPVALTS